MYIYYRLVHAFTAAGILPRQYINFGNFAGIGNVGKWYISKGIIKGNHNYVELIYIVVYKNNGYIEVVQAVAEQSMKLAVDEANHVSGEDEVGLLAEVINVMFHYIVGYYGCSA